MLDREHPASERVSRVILTHRHRRLGNDWAGIGFRNDEMNGGARKFDAGP